VVCEFGAAPLRETALAEEDPFRQLRRAHKRTIAALLPIEPDTTLPFPRTRKSFRRIFLKHRYRPRKPPHDPLLRVAGAKQNREFGNNVQNIDLLISLTAAIPPNMMILIRMQIIERLVYNKRIGSTVGRGGKAFRLLRIVINAQARSGR